MLMRLNEQVRRTLWAAVAVATFALSYHPIRADGTAQTLPFSQDWSDTGLITADDTWSGVSGIVGYRGDDLTTATGTDPRTILADGTTTPIDVIANQTNPNTLATGGVAEFHVADPTIALQGSGTADAPFVLIHLDTTGQSGIQVSYNLRDIDGSADNSVQPVALQYRVVPSGSFTNVPAGFVADATSGPSLATLVTPVSVTLPAAADNQPLVQLRIITTNAVGSDEWVGLDDISIVPGVAEPTPPTGIGSAVPSAVEPGDTTLIQVTVTPGTNPTSTGVTVVADLFAIGGSSSQAFFDDATNGDLAAGDDVFSFLATVAAGTTDGSKTLPATVSDAEGRSASAPIFLTVLAPPMPSATIVISQVYGGGGNSGATLRNDFIELFNRGTTTANVSGWTVQYASATGTGGWQTTPLSGSIPPGRYYLVQEAAGSGGTTELPVADTVGTIAMAAGSGKVALVGNAVALSGACPAATEIVDLVGYGSANCSETSPTPVLSNTTAALRNDGGSTDTNDNSADFTVGAPDPRNSSGRPPRGVGAAVPASLAAGESSLLTVTVTTGAYPDATSVTVTCNVAPIGGASSVPFLDDGAGGDATAGDSVFSYRATVALGTTVGSKSLSCTVADDLARASVAVITLIVEPPLLAIHQVQGPGLTSSYAGQLVATEGIVTGLKFNGFFVQTPDAAADADPGTSEGIFVFTSSLPSLSPGDFVKVAGTVSEFIPPQDMASPPITEIAGTPAVTILSTGQPLPAPITLTAADTSSSGSLEQLERLEGMRVRVEALRVIAPTQRASLNEVDAVSTSNGVFYGVVNGVTRPVREPGIAQSDSLPAGAPCCVPRFDENPERLRVDSDGQPGGLPLEVAAGALVSNVIGPLDFSFRTWTVLPDPATPPAVSGVASAVAVPEPSENEFTVGAFNMERFFDTTDAGIGEPVLTEQAFQNRLNKASLAIRNVMRSPDVLGVEEAENLSTLQALAAKINADTLAAGDPDPVYEAHLYEGNDIGGIDSGFLVKRARVHVIDVTQVGKTATYLNPNTGAPELLNDRPPLVLRATVQGPVGAPFPITVIVNHLRSLNGIDDETLSGSGTNGARVRAKRRAQAEFLAALIQSRQVADPTERIVSVGDYNAFEVNDGYVDVIGTVRGTPTPADRVVLASADLVNPDLSNLLDALPADQRYSYSFDGNAQTLDHVLVNASLMKRFSRFHYARNDADFPESFRNDPDRPERLSDHDMPVAYFAFPGAPRLTLLGANPMAVECHAAFADPGATASDEDLGDLTAAIQVVGSVDPHALGTYTLTYTVSNGFRTTTMTRTVNVVDTIPPSLTLLGGNPVVVELGASFTDPGATAVDDCAGNLTGHIRVAGSVNTRAVGSYVLTYTVSDGHNTAQATRTVNVVDTRPPAITAVAASPNVLWPPNHRLVPVVMTVAVSDNSGSTTCKIVSVRSNEPSWFDWVITGDLTLKLRAERSGRGNGRVYTIGVRCADPSGNAATGRTTVTVPKRRH